MKTGAHKQRGLSAVEVALVIATVALVMAVLLPLLASRQHRQRHNPQIRCLSNLKQVGLAARIWANDHDDKFPFAFTNSGGSRAFFDSPLVFQHFAVMSNELVTPKILVCPADTRRVRAADFRAFNNTNLSYFVGLDADESKPNQPLTGDRNVQGGTLSNGFLRVLRPLRVPEEGWTTELHNRAGNLGLSDGSAMQTSTRTFREVLDRNSNDIIRLAIP